MRFGILGRLEVHGADGNPLDLGGAQPRLITAALVAADGRTLTADALIDAIWGERPPASPIGSLQTYISRLRRHLGAGALVWDAPGYRLVVERHQVDAWRFEQLADDGRAALVDGDPERARRLLLEGEALWRGSALPEVADIDQFRGVASRLEERRLVAAEHRFEAELELGRHELIVGELAQAVISQPFREVLRSQLALALYRSGRQAEALRSISAARTTFADELGIELSADLRQTESAILRHDPSLDAPASPVRLARMVRHAALQPSPAALVGRTSEFEVLSEALAGVGRGCSSVIIEGAPGIGKTRLVEEFGRAAAGAGVKVVSGSGYEGSAAPSWWPWLNILDSILEFAPGAICRELDELLHPSSEGAAEVSPSRRFELHEAVRRALELAAHDGPLVVVLDDLQWFDEASLELLSHLARTPGDAPVLFVAMLRELEIGTTDSVTQALGVLSRRTATRRIHLDGLGESEIAALLKAAVGVDLPPEVAKAINGRAEGNPFYAVELARNFHESGLSEPERMAAAAVPASLADVVRERLDRLPGSTRQLLHVAAVIGREVDSSLLLRAAGRGPEAFDDLEPAFAHRFLDEVPTSPGVFRFTHALVREVLIDEITTLREARLHLRIADALEARPEMSDSDREILAEHLYAARSVGVASRAAAALRQAAGVAIRRSAYAAAEQMLDRAASLLVAAEDVPDRQNAELDVLVALFFAQRASHGHDVALSRPPYLRAKQLAQTTGRVDVQARLLWAQWVGVDKGCDSTRSKQLAAELADLAASSGVEMVEGLSNHAAGVIHWHAGELPAAAAALDRAAQLNRAWASTSRAAVQSIIAPVSPSAWPRGHPVVTFLHMLIGDVDDPIGEFERMASDDLQPFGSTVVWMFAAFGALAIGDIDAAVACGRRGLEADPDLVFTYWGPGAHMALGAALAVSGELDEGLELIARSMPRYLASGTRIFVPLVHARLAQAMSRDGRDDEAASQFARARTLAHEYAERWLEPVLLAVEAELLHARSGDVPAALAMLEAAAQLAGEQGAHAIARNVCETATRLNEHPTGD
jgi:DNA-binding SARP family transcriptional activator/tetratricopeptide (TPR) repeat protein